VRESITKYLSDLIKYLFYNYMTQFLNFKKLTQNNISQFLADSKIQYNSQPVFDLVSTGFSE